ncbi:unnamed protein product [Rotaria sordida]|uniref:Myb/SANT-like DNA-binding domain-containing protein n=1 Tax=Rotaria sordida TaxID=392033 RepID=A0A814F4S3_9BILA|nr:unnamed protein product [Rotaria sordida]CAF1348162.1 unnamed protein product [Rotaria sordida]CAF3789306.1 unnamed protein product [Rotaria sordida]CAF3999533.1 unnamed protein product [Rotaria sordida]
MDPKVVRCVVPSNNIFKLNILSQTLSQPGNVHRVLNVQTPSIPFQVLNQVQSPSVITKAARIIITSPSTLNLSNELTQSNVDNPRLEPMNVETPQSASSSRIDVPIVRSNSIETPRTTDNHSSSIAAVLQSTPSSSTKKKNKRIKELDSKTTKRCKNWSEKETITFIAVWSEYYLRLTTGGTRHAPIYDKMAKQLNEMSMNRCFTGHDVKKKIGNLVSEYRRKKKEQGKTGASPSPWPYYDLLDKLLGERPYNDDSLLSDSMITEQEQLLDDLDNVSVPDYNLTQAAEQTNDFTSIVNDDELIIDEREHSFTASSPSESNYISKSEISAKNNSEIKKCVPKRKKRASEMK